MWTLWAWFIKQKAMCHMYLFTDVCTMYTRWKDEKTIALLSVPCLFRCCKQTNSASLSQSHNNLCFHIGDSNSSIRGVMAHRVSLHSVYGTPTKWPMRSDDKSHGQLNPGAWDFIRGTDCRGYVRHLWSSKSLFIQTGGQSKRHSKETYG